MQIHAIICQVRDHLQTEFCMLKDTVLVTLSLETPHLISCLVLVLPKLCSKNFKYLTLLNITILSILKDALIQIFPITLLYPKLD